MRSFVDSLKKELQITLNSQLDQLKDRFERDFVAKDIWTQQNTFAGDKWSRIETRLEDIGRNVHQYNDTVLRAILNMERENRDERFRAEQRDNNRGGD